MNPIDELSPLLQKLKTKTVRPADFIRHQKKTSRRGQSVL